MTSRLDVLKFWEGYASNVREKFVTRKNYLRIDGRPVLFHGYAHSMLFYEKFGVSPSEIVQTVRSVIPNAYLIATATEREVRPLLKSWGFDAHSDYLLHGKGWDDTMATYRWSWNEGLRIAKETGIHYWPSCTSGYDGTAWNTPESRAGFSHIPTPEQFTAHVREAKKFSADNARWTLGRVCCYALNEFGEQKTPLEPTVLNGDAYLRAFKEAA